MSWWDSLWKSQAKDFIYVEIPGDKTRTGLTQTPLVPKTGYIRIFLRTWRIDSIGEGWTQFFGAVHGFVSLARFGQGRVETDSFTSPNQLQQADPKHANRIIAMDFPLFGPVPYMGGDLDLRIGLFSIKSGDLAGPFIEMLTSVANAAGGGAYVAAAQPFIAPLKKGIEALTDTGQDSRLEIGLVKTYDKPSTGYFAVIRAEQSQINKTKLRIDNDGHLVDDSTGQPIKDFPYFVFSIESVTQHDTWWEVPALAQAYADLTTIVNDENASDATVQSAFLRFRKKVKLLPDLIPADMDRVIAEAKAKIEDVRGVPVTEAATPKIAATKTTIGFAAAKKPAKKAVAAPPPRKRAKMPVLKSLKIYK